MIFPNKVTAYNQSVISKLPVILKYIQEGERDVHNLYKRSEYCFEEIAEYIYALDVLYLLNKIDKIEGDKIYVKADKK